MFFLNRERLGDVRGAGLSFRPLPSPVPTFISHSLQSLRRNRINDVAIVDKLIDLTIWEEISLRSRNDKFVWWFAQRAKI